MPPPSGSILLTRMLGCGLAERPAPAHLVLFYAAYVLAAGFGQGLAIVPGISITFWPPAGIFVATLLLNSVRSWTWWVAAGCLAELTANAIWFKSPVPLALVYFAANGLEALTAAFLVRRALGRPFTLGSLREVSTFVALGAGIAPMVGATIIALTDAIVGKHDFATAWFLVWLGDASGLLVSTPIALGAIETWRQRAEIPAQRLMEAAILAAVLLATDALSLAGYLPTIYMTMPALLWAAVRFQLKGAAAALAVVTLTTAVLTAGGRGEFAGSSPELLEQNIVLLQTFLGIAAVSTLMVAALSEQYRTALRSLRLTNASLEERVAERTESLRDSEGRLQAALRAGGLGVHDFDPQTRRISWDARVRELWGVPADQSVTYETFESGVHPDDLPALRSTLAKALDPRAADGSHRYVAEYRLRPRDGGEPRWVHADGDVTFAGGKAVRLIGTVADVTERKRAAEALRAKEVKFRRTFENAAVGMAHLKLDGRWIDVNEKLCQITGYGREELLGLRWQDLTLPEDAAVDLVKQGELVAGTIDMYSLEKRYIRKDGSTVSVAISVSLARKSSGEPDYLISVVRDISERLRARAALEASEERYRLALHTGRLGIWETDFRGGVRRWAPEAMALFDLELADGIGRFGGESDELRMRIHPEDRHLLDEQQHAFLGEDAVRTAYRIVRRDGEVRWMEGSGSVLERDADGHPLRGIHIVADVTDRMAADEALRKSEELLRLASEAAGFGVYDFDAVRRRGVWSEGLRRITGIDPQGEVGFDTVLSTIHPEDRERISAEMLAITRRPGPYEVESRIVRPDGSVRWILDRGRAVGPADPESGLVRRITGTVLDITARKEAEQAQLIMRVFADRANDLFSLSDSETGRFTYVNETLVEALGYSREEVLGLSVSDVDPDWSIERFRELAPRLAAGERLPPFESRLLRKDRSELDVEINVNLVEHAGRRYVGAVLRDATERKRRDAQVRVLLREVNHRSKNMLSLVQAIARQTAATNPDEFLVNFSQRIQAMSANQDLLVKNDWRGVDMIELVHAQLAPFADLLGKRISVNGPSLRLTAPAAQAIGMALHELATNASKYGALSNEAGRVDVRWMTAADRLIMRWTERDGPAVGVRGRSGFGSKVIEQMTEAGLGGTVVVDRAPSGVAWRLECPLANALDMGKPLATDGIESAFGAEKP